MDPDVLLKEIRELSAKVISQTNDFDCSDDVLEMSIEASDLAEKVKSLDELIMSGGNLPKEWKEKLLGKLFAAYKNDRSISTSCHETMWDLEKAHRELFGLKDNDNIEDAEMK